MVVRAVGNTVMSQDKTVRDATSSYIDDVYVSESVASSQRVKEHLESGCLVCKDPRDGSRTGRGLQLQTEGGRLRWKRGSDIPEVAPVLYTTERLLRARENGWPRHPSNVVPNAVTSRATPP